MMNPAEIMKEVAAQVAVCEKCNLHHSRKKSVPGEGPVTAKIMFIGEGPGFYENEQGRPFVGPSGHFLDELLSAAGLKRSEVFIGNVVKCRPPGNRDPLPDELGSCRPYLERQIAAINPEVIVTLGRYSMAHFLPNAKISIIHGRSSRINGRLVIPMYHPAAALHQPALKEAILSDFANLPKLIAAAAASSGANDPAQAGKAPAVQRPAALPLPEQAAFDLTPQVPQLPEAPTEGDQLPPEGGTPGPGKTDPKDKANDKPVQLPLF